MSSRIHDSYRQRFKSMLFVGFLLAVRVPVNGAVNQWTTNGPDGGFITAMAVAPANPDVLYAGVYEGARVFRSTDGGANWAEANDGLAGQQVFCLATDPIDPLKVYVGLDTGTFISTDGAVTWKQAGTNILFAPHALAVDLSDRSTIYAEVSNAIIRSLDGGMSWEVVRPGFFGYAFGIAQGWGSVYVSTWYGGVQKSTDRGRTWSTLTLPPGAGKIVIDPVRMNTAYTYGRNGFYESDDGGLSWSHKSAALGDASPYISPTGTVLYLNSATGLFQSTDHGGTWALLTSELLNIGYFIADVLLAFDPQREGRFYAFDHSILKTTDGGSSWIDATHGIINSTVSALAIDPTAPGSVYADGDKSVDGGTTWTPMRFPGTAATATAIAIDPSNPTTVYAVAGAILKSTDGGNTWTTMNPGGPSYGFSSLAIDPVTPSTIYASAYSDGVYKSIDSGATWTRLPLDPYTASGPVQSVVVAPSQPQVVYVTGAYGTFRSDDAGATWVAMGGRGGGRLVVDPADSQLLYLVTNFSHVLKTTDGGRTWELLFDLRQCYGAVATDPHLPNVVYFGTAVCPIVLSAASVRIGAPEATAATSGATVYRSKDAGKSWVALANPLANAVTITALGVAPSDPSIIYAGTQASGMYAIKLVPLAGDANEDFTVGVADVFYLIHYLFAAGPPPSATADANGDGAVNASDIFYLINYLFADGPSPR